MKIRHWDEASQSWVIDGASNASNLELTNPSFLDEEGKSVTVDHGFTKVANKLTKLEQNLAWVYLNGAKGGTGGTGGTGDTSYTMTVEEGTTVYTSTSSTDVHVTINSGTIKKAFTVIAKNIVTNTIIGTWKIYSLTRSKITLSGLSGTVDVELSAYDSANNYTIPKYVKVVAGALSLSIQSIPNVTIYIGGSNPILANYTIYNNILGNACVFTLKINNITLPPVTGITESIRTISYNLRDIIFNSGQFTPVTGQRFKVQAQVSTILNGVSILSNSIEYEMTVADSQKLLIITNNITTFEPSEEINETYQDLTAVNQGSRLVFPYYLSYGLTKYTSFTLIYKVFKVTNIGEELISENTITNLLPNDINKILSLNVPWDATTNPDYYKIELKAFATSAPNDLDASDTKYVTFRIEESDSVIMTANNDNKTLLAYYSNITGFPNDSKGTWNYTPSVFEYTGAFSNKFPNGVNLTLKDVNGITSGFLPETALPLEAQNQIPGIRLEGESYGYLEVAEQMFPNKLISTGESFFQEGGFNISFTYRAKESSDPEEVIVSMGKYSNGLLLTGFEVTLEQIYLKIGSQGALTCKLPQNYLLTIDIDVSFLNGGWYFKIFINGVLSAVTRVDGASIDWLFGTDLYLGCRYDNGVRSRFSNVTFYDIKLYTSSQSEYAIVQNYISATEQASLINGLVDKNLDTELRLKNFFNDSGECIIWDKTANGGKGDFLSGQLLFSTLQSQITNTYPIILVEETSNEPTLFKAYSTAVFSAGEKDVIMEKKFPIKVTYITPEGSVDIITPPGVDADKGVSIGLQGTSSLSYSSKNYELYIGDKNASGEKLLFQVKDDWLPENIFTLKADVMDSSHVNNVVIGKIINGAVGNIKPLDNTPPMSLADAYWGGDSTKANSIRSKIKHTSDGFPALLFIRYAKEADGILKEPEFKGIYNFNLGRHAYYNLGLKILSDYTKINQNGPTLVSEYTDIGTIWNTGVDGGAYSIEINQNTSSQGAFQQDDLEIVKFMGDVTYSSNSTETAYSKVQKFYNQMANMALTTIPKYTMDSTLQFPDLLIGLNVSADKWISGVPYALNTHAFNNQFMVFKSLIDNNLNPIPNTVEGDLNWQYINTITSTYGLDLNTYYNFNKLDQHLNWQNACGYFMIALIFGMVDSMCKNLTLRSWGTDVWSTAFYDMDTAFGLNNQGQDIVPYYAHLHRWQNFNLPDSNLTSYEIIKNYQSGEGYQQYYASYWNRIWEVLENLPGRDSGGLGNKDTLESMYTKLRVNLFPDPDEFIDTYYKGYTDQTGSIMFNYDYKIKYLKITQTYNAPTNEYIDTTDFTQLSFLHGNRVMQVKDWFRKRIHFLDSIYGVKGNDITIPTNIESPVNSVWINNKATGSASGTKFVAQMSSISKILYRYSFDQTTGSFWLDENIKDVIVPIPNGETRVSIYANDYITNFNRFKSYPWTSLNTIDLPLIKELDLSNLSTVPSNNFFNEGGVYDFNNNIGLKNIRSLNLSNVVLTGENAAAYNLILSNCSKLQNLNISNSSITKVTLPTSTVLKTYNLSGTNVTELLLENQAFLETLVLDNCNLLTSIEIVNCNKLTNLNIPKNVTSVKISNCELLTSLQLPYNSTNNSISSLSFISIDGCPGLRTFSIAGQNNPALVVELVGAPNLTDLNLSRTNTLDITLPVLFADGLPNFTSLRSLDISNTGLSTLKYNDYPNIPYLDLSYFPNLDSINAKDCKQLVKVVCVNNPDNPIDLGFESFANCTALTTLYGNFRITAPRVFRGCSALTFNTEEVYNDFGTNDFLEGNNVANLSISPNLNTLIGCFEDCSNISYNDFKYIKVRIGTSITSLEAAFKNCSKINGPITYDLFRNCPNLITIKEAFSGCKLYGPFYSRSNSYSYEDDSTWGIFDFIPNIEDAEAAFEYNALEWIDNKVFAPRLINDVLTYSSLVKVDRIFRGCSALKSSLDTRAADITSGNLNSETFFTNLRNLIDLYPKDVFSGCTGIKMDIINDGDNSYLFHTIRDSENRAIVLDSSLYNGVSLIGDVKVNVFGGKSRTLTKGELTYYLPKFTSIQYPFMGTLGNATINLSQMGEIFRNINSTILQAIGVFKGLTIDTGLNGLIPPDIFKGCVALNSIDSLFSDLNLSNNGEEYTFPASYIDGEVTKGMFDDCVSLKVTRNLFAGCNNLKIKLVGEGFKNCQLENVDNMFSNSGLFGTIPYRLFFMTKTVNDLPVINRTIVSMENLFYGCWNLGYTSDRTINVGEVLTGNLKTQWAHHIVKTSGDKVSYKLPMSGMQKTYNYNKNEILGDPQYNPGELEFDSWYLDGYAWEGATALNPEEQTELDEQKARLYSRYLFYDERQKNVIINNENNDRYKDDCYQNYIIPTDLFRYCSKDATLINSLQGLNWIENIIEIDESTGNKSISSTGVVEGLTGRIPVKLFESLVDNTILSSVFKNCKIDAFVGLDSYDSTFDRGIMFPPDLFKYNVALREVPSMFENIIIPVGVDINPDLFYNNGELRNISRLFSNCIFNKQRIKYPAAEVDIYPQINFTELFKNNTLISNASGVFAVYIDEPGIDRGLQLIEHTLFSSSKNITNVSSMFYNNKVMKGSVPLFEAGMYPILTSFSDYLYGVVKTNITNAEEVELRLRPSEWN